MCPLSLDTSTNQYSRDASLHLVQKQIVVDNVIDILVYFRKANFVDCRVSAYPYREKWEAILHGEQPPDTLFIDLDFNQFKSKLALDRTLHKTLKNIKVKLCCPDAKPSILESGSGAII